MVEFQPDIQDVAKILAMEENIRDVLRKAQFEEIELETEPPYDDASTIFGGPSTNPLQIDLSEYGLEPNPYLVEGPGQRAKNLMNPEPPRQSSPAQAAADEDPNFAAMLSEGPQGNNDTDDGPLPLFQWQIATEAPANEAVKTKLNIGGWNFVVSWTVNPTEDLVYASLQARLGTSYAGKTRPNPAGRTEDVNLVFDRQRSGIVAIDGTVRDFRPFVEAFYRAYAGETWNDLRLRGRSVERRQ